jgi:hypothetical protein
VQVRVQVEIHGCRALEVLNEVAFHMCRTTLKDHACPAPCRSGSFLPLRSRNDGGNSPAATRHAPVRIAKSHVSLRRGNEGALQAFPWMLEGWTMWALFADGKQVSRAFQTEKEAWHLARKSSLLDAGRLSKGFEIRQIAERTHAA